MDTKRDRPVRFGAWLESQLLRREWSRSDLARRLGTRPATVSRWINGTRIPDPVSVDKIADVLGADLDTLLTIAGHRAQALDEDPESPEAILCGLVRHVSWDESRFELVRAMLTQMLEFDRRRREEATPS